jgi:hypothetical protein
MRRSLFAALVLAAVAAPAQKLPARMDYQYFLGRLTDLESLYMPAPGVRCAQASSYDRASRYDASTGEYVAWDANGDHGHYVRVDEKTGEAVMADLKGPGCVFRIWSANPQGKIRLYLDGATTANYEFEFRDIFTGATDPFLPPLVWARDEGGRASDSFLPIPYRESLLITADKAHDQYYHIGYVTYPAGANVQSFDLPLTADERAALEKARAAWKKSGEFALPEGAQEEGEMRLGVGEQQVRTYEGPGVIRMLGFKLKGEAAKRHDRAVRVTIYWDGHEKPAVDAPLNELFGMGFQDGEYSSYPLGMTKESGYCYFPMPFHKEAKIVVSNEGSQEAEVSYQMRWEQTGAQEDAMYFHAKWRRERACDTFDYPILECTGGPGRFVGCVLFIDNLLGGWWGEGDEKVYVDGEKFPSTFGTGSEDYFGDAWGIRHFVNPNHGCPLPNPVLRHQICYRWHLSDSIPFDKSFRITIENYSARAETKNDYATIAYWYQAAGGSDFFKPTTWVERRPLPPVIVSGAREAESLGIVPEDSVEIVDDDLLSRGSGVRIPAGREARIPIKVESAGRYIIDVFRAPMDRIPGAMLRFEGKPLGEVVPLESGAGAVTLNKVRLAAGVNYVTIEPKEPLVIDYLQLSPWRNFVYRWMVIGPFPNEDGAGLNVAYVNEQTVGLSEPPKASGDEAPQWRQVRASPGGILDFASVFSPNTSVVAYAACVVVSPDDRDARLLLGSDDGVKVWVNGKQVWVNPRQRPVELDEDKVPASLKEGRNLILVKVEQGGGDWGLALRVDDPDEELRYEVPLW